jgi:hypothetical protein
MRIAIAAFCVLALTGSAEACATRMPPKEARQPPSVKYEVFYVARPDLQKYCQSETEFSCTYPTGEGKWAVVINRDLSHDEVICSLIYEKAHMPPNYWADPRVESPLAVQFLRKLRRAH